MQLTTQLSRTPVPVLILRFAGLEIGNVLRRAARALGIHRPVTLSLDNLAVPDSNLARQATTLARGCEPDFLLNHSVRSYLFGLAVGRHMGLRPDHELLYLAAILHDIALTPPYDGDGSFEVNGARAAREFLVRHHVPAERADLVHEAIALHTAVGIAGSREPEIALMHFGAGLDVIGFHNEDVATATREAIVHAWPRVRFKAEFPKLIEDQAQRKPDCHIAGHFGLGFNRKIAAAPFAD
jgi:cyanamide hydratase family protein with HD domain